MACTLRTDNAPGNDSSVRYLVTLAITALASLTAGCAALLTAGPAPMPKTTDDFCARAQAAIVGAQPIARNEVHTNLDTFVKSKPVARPLVTTQYVTRERDTPDAVPMLVSCKMKTADHLVSEYGADAAGADIGCKGVNEITLREVLASLSPEERRRLRFDGGRRVSFDEDIVTTLGPVWLESYAFARIGGDGGLHLQSKAMRNDWLDPRYLNAPAQFRGTRYCHLVAPEHLRRLLLGEVAPISAS